MKTIYVLFTEILGRQNFVANHVVNRSHDNKKIVNYTTEKHKAKDFGSIADAEQFIPHIMNPHERVYTADAIEVDERLLQEDMSLAEETIK
jgi:hypothetical protein